MTDIYKNFEIKPCREEHQKGAFSFSRGACNYTPGGTCFESKRLTRRAIDAWYMAGGKSPLEHGINAGKDMDGDLFWLILRHAGTSTIQNKRLAISVPSASKTTSVIVDESEKVQVLTASSFVLELQSVKEILALSEMLHKAAIVLQHRRITGKVNDISESYLSL